MDKWDGEEKKKRGNGEKWEMKKIRIHRKEKVI